MNKWSTVHTLYSPDEPLTADNSVAKFKSDGDAQNFADLINDRPYIGWVAVKRTWGQVYVLPKPSAS